MRSVLIFSFFTLLTGGLAQLAKIYFLNNNKYIYDMNSDDGINGEILAQLFSLITTGSLEHFAGCKILPSIPDNDITYYLYTRSHHQPTPLNLDNLSELDIIKITKIIVHGFAATATDDYLLAMVNAYLARYDCNVITVDYKNLTNVLYTQPYCNVIVGADMMADFFCKLNAAGHLNFSNTHLLGLSLGGQTVGLIGGNIQQICNQTVDRITAFDPAGPIYQNQDISKRLDKTDAKFVDAIHTDMGVIGYYGSVGHVDFFPNCGTLQPGCINLTSASAPSITDIILYFPCSHGRSALFFTESIPGTGTVFKSTSCSTCPNSKSIGKCLGPDSFSSKYAIMGEDCPRSPSYNKFYLTTNSNSPYAQG